MKRKKAEIEFCENTLRPLFEAMPFIESVRYRHGNTEFGKDFTFSFKNPLNVRVNAGVQAKWGDIRGSSTSIIGQVVDQIKTAFIVPYKNKPEGQELHINELYFICSGEYKNNAIEIIERALEKNYTIFFLDGSDVDTLRKGITLRKTEQKLEEKRTLNALLIEIEQNMQIAFEIVNDTEKWIENKLHLLLRYRLNCIEKTLDLNIPRVILDETIKQWNNLTIQNNLLNEIALSPMQDQTSRHRKVCDNAKTDIRELQNYKSHILDYLKSIE